jgi:acyl-CoA reductase-like NAD-dependent aldehyde dehydrogenase
MGPLVSRGQYERVMGFVQSGLKEGAKLLTGGKRPEGQPKGTNSIFSLTSSIYPKVSIWNPPFLST